MISARYARQAHALMRIGFALIFLNYGLQKFGFFGGVDGQGSVAPFLSWPFGLAGAIEVVTGALTLVGLWTRPAALVATAEMAVAYLWVHQFHGLEIGQGFGPTPVQNNGQAAVLLFFGFLYLATHGAGMWSVDDARASAPPAAARTSTNVQSSI
jgi:putative oxidoreductase